MKDLIRKLEEAMSLDEGWDIAVGSEKADLVYDLLDDKRWSPGARLIDSKLSGNELWQVWYVPKAGKNIIILDLLKKFKDGWGNKTMSEGEGPYYYKCPKRFLELAPVENQDWRDAILGKKSSPRSNAQSQASI